MKKIVTALCLSSTLFVACAAQAGWQGNWLLGVSAGGAWHSNDDFGGTITHPNALGSTAFSLGEVDNDDDSFIWGFLAGYQARCNGWVIGGEVNVDWRGNGDDDNSFSFVDPVDGLVTGSVSSDRDTVWGITARFGYEVSCYFMPYIRLGVDNGGRNFDFVAVNGANYAVVSNGDNDNHRWGFVGGIGAEFPIPAIAGLSVRAEWNYHARGGDDNDIVALASDQATLYTVSVGDRHEQTARASLVWNFPI